MQQQTIDNQPTTAMVRQAIREELAKRRGSLPDGVDAEVVMRYGGFVGCQLECHPRLGRAMDRARAQIRDMEAVCTSVASGRVILADTMDGTKGRFTRVWHAPPGGVWGCLVHANTLLDISRTFVPLAVGVACCEAVHAVGGRQASLRWVNDVLFGERKVAGFLVEGFTGPRFGEVYNLVGFGINVNNRAFPAELASTAVSLAEMIGEDLDLAEFTALFLAKLAWNFGLIHFEEACCLASGSYSGHEGRHLLLDSWLRLSDSIGQRVVYGFDVINRPQYEATVAGLEPDGGLQMVLDDGSTIVEHSGEIRYL